MKVLITGTGGFIGQNAAEYLIQNGADVTGIYHMQKPERISCRLYACDLAKERIENYIGKEKYDAVLHFAGQMRGNRVCQYLDNTVEGTKRLIEYAESAQIPCFMYISSISVYGETVAAVDEKSDRINLDDYGISKYLCERLLEDAAIEKRVVIRLPRILGKGCDLSYPWLPKVTKQMLNHETVSYMNPELEYNNMLYVDDLSVFLLHLINTSLAGFERFVLGAKGRMKILDILNLLKQNLSSDSKLIEKKSDSHNKCYAINTSHAEAYGFASRSIEEIIQKFAQDVREHAAG